MVGVVSGNFCLGGGWSDVGDMHHQTRTTTSYPMAVGRMSGPNEQTGHKRARVPRAFPARRGALHCPRRKERVCLKSLVREGSTGNGMPRKYLAYGNPGRDDA